MNETESVTTNYAGDVCGIANRASDPLFCLARTNLKGA